MFYTANSMVYANDIFYMKEINIETLTECKILRLKYDKFSCKKDGANYVYNKNMVEYVKYKGIKIYPYDNTVRISEDDIFNKDCDYILKNITGPLNLERDSQSLVLVGMMYENGICISKNSNMAIKYYKSAGQKGQNKYYALQKKLKEQESDTPTKKINNEMLITLQQESDVKRMKKEMQTKICKNECSLEYSTRDKYRYDQQCFSDCMAHNGF